MEALFVWSLKASGLLVVLFSVYYFLFRNNTAFQLRRMLILSLIGICLIAPFLELEVSENQSQIVQQAYEIQRIITQPIAPAKAEPEKSLTVTALELTYSKFEWKSLLLKTYLVGIAISLAFLLFEIIRVFALLLSSQKDSTLGRNVFRHHAVKSPFSFGRWIFIPKHARYPESSWAIILRHELVHVGQKHTLDLILTKLVQSLLWYNPIIYVLQREFKAMHEALADDNVLQQFDFKTYAGTLMNVSLATQEISVTHSFAVTSSFSKRLKLMKTHRTKLKTTLLSIVAISLFSFGIIGWSSLKG